METILIILLGLVAFLRPSAANSCLDLTGTGHKCKTNATGYTSLSTCGLTDADVQGGALALCLDEAGRGNITGLSLSTNALTTLPAGVFQGLESMTYLKLYNNSLDTLTEGDFQDLMALEELDLAENALTTLPDAIFYNLTALRKLNLRDNAITTLPEGVFQRLGALQELWLQRNDLTTPLPEGAFQGLSDLRDLRLNEDGLTTLPEGIFQDLASLTELYLADNALTTLPEGVFRNLPALEELSLPGNSLTDLSETIFQNLTVLVELWLYDNNLTFLPKNIFKDLTALEYLSLANNTLTTLPEVLLQNQTDLLFLNLKGNSLECLPDLPSPLIGRENYNTNYEDYEGLLADAYGDECGCAISGVTSVCGGEETCTPGEDGYTCAPATPAPVSPATPAPTSEPEGISPAPTHGDIPLTRAPAPGTLAPESGQEPSSEGASSVGIVVGCVAGALAIGLATLGFFLRRRRQAAKTTSAADPPAPLPDGGDNLEEGRGEQDQQHAAFPADIGIGDGSKPAQTPFAAPRVGASKMSSSEEAASGPGDKNGSGAYSWAAGAARGWRDAAGDGGGGNSDRLAAAEQLVPPLTATNSTAYVSTEERTDEQRYGSGFSAEEGVDDAPAAKASATTTAAAAGGRGKTSSGVEYGQAALAAAQELAHHCQIPGVSAAATAVSILIHLVIDSRDSSSRGDAGVKRCRSIVMQLERAAKVLGKGGDRNSEAERVLIEEVRDAVFDLVDLIKTYQSKNRLSKVLTSTLFKRRQEEMDAVVDRAILHLHLGLQVQVGQDVAEGLHLHKRSAAEARAETLAEARRTRRQRKLERVEIPEDQVVITDEMLGKGGFGEVYLADYNGHNAAAKVQHIVHGFGKRDGLNEPKSGQADAVRERTQRKAFLRELDAMIRLRHPHTVNVFGAITSLTDRLILVMELLAGGDLRTMLRNSEQPLPEDRCRQIIKDICAGMAFLHSKSTVHGDLKSANVLLDARGRAKIGDFGTSRWTQNAETSTGLATYTTNPGPSAAISFAWTAPEVLEKQKTSKASDVYSFGMVVWEVLSRQTPWADQAQPRDIYLRVVIHGDRPVIPADAPADIVEMLHGCWAQEPKRRPSFQALLDREGKVPVK